MFCSHMLATHEEVTRISKIYKLFGDGTAWLAACSCPELGSPAQVSGMVFCQHCCCAFYLRTNLA